MYIMFLFTPQNTCKKTSMHLNIGVPIHPMYGVNRNSRHFVISVGMHHPNRIILYGITRKTQDSCFKCIILHYYLEFSELSTKYPKKCSYSPHFTVCVGIECSYVLL